MASALESGQFTILFFPVSGATLPGLIETYVANQNVKAFVLANLGNRRNDDGKRIIWEGSDTQYVLDETREWQVSEENYDPATGQSVVTLNAALRGVPMLFSSFAPSRHDYGRIAYGY